MAFRDCIPNKFMLQFDAEEPNGTDNSKSVIIDDNPDQNLSIINITIPYLNKTSTVFIETQPDRDDEMGALEMAHSVFKIIQPIVCVFGLLGNILTLLILTRKRLKMSCDGVERTVNFGLTALAVSDLMFCLSLLPHGFIKQDQFAYVTKSFALFYKTYSGAPINTFILTSTWLTVIMATNRYLAICHPFRARHVIGMKGTKVSMMLVFVVCALFNIPRVFRLEITSLTCIGGKEIYFPQNGFLNNHKEAYTIYIWIYFMFGILLPLAALAFCNICLVKALRESAKLRKQYRVPAAHVDSNYRVTSILVTIVLMYILLVFPAELLLFIQDRLPKNKHYGFLLAVEFTNVLQCINFACNFVLYFMLNVHFRQALKDMCCNCIPTGRNKQDATQMSAFQEQLLNKTKQTVLIESTQTG